MNLTTKEEIIGIWWFPPNFEKLQQVEKLPDGNVSLIKCCFWLVPVNIANNSDGRRDVLNIGFIN